MANHAVIMAGGAGTRLWPLSRATRPKQLLRLFGGKSLLRHSFERLADFIEPININVITSEQHVPLVHEELPELSEDNLWGEPAVRDTANAVCLSACLLQARDPEGVMGIFTADHLITPQEQFRSAVQNAYAAASENRYALVTLGITPRWAATGYGYVQRGTQLDHSTHEVQAFKEKPDRQTAERYLADGGYYWNSGMFVWAIEAIMTELQRHLAASVNALTPIAQKWGSPGAKEELALAFPELTKISIDYAVMEKANRVLLVEMPCDWLDVGSLTSVAAAFEPDTEGNISVLENQILLEATNNILISEDDHLVAAFGVDDLVIVHSADATLVCRRHDAERLKELVGTILEKYGKRYV
jgi:mannose-1-phosphate guanylyltransferase